MQDGIEVRFAAENEKITLLDEQQLTLRQDELIIASNNQPIALAGILGGVSASVTTDTTEIFLESALFNSEIIAKTARRRGIFTDSSHRFERGVDCALQKIAIERATQLILKITGGIPGEIIIGNQFIAKQKAILLRRNRIQQVLGIELQSGDIISLLERLNMQVHRDNLDWQVVPPSYRQDIHSEIDLIEEIARLTGFENLPDQPLTGELHFIPETESQLKLIDIKHILVNQGYQEAITYSFVDPVYEQQLGSNTSPLTLLNPISVELSVMRSNHWSGLIKAYQYNTHRQQPRIRLFELGLCFNSCNDQLIQTVHLGGLSAGPILTEQWGESKRLVDFYDIKNDIENLFKWLKRTDYHFEKSHHLALHPGQSADIFCNQICVGSIGALHPKLVQKFDIEKPVYLFDINLNKIMNIPLPKYSQISKFPAIRRDLAIVVASDIAAGKIKEKILESGGNLLKNVQIFDVYHGKAIGMDKKSIALGLTFQHFSRTLVDSEINEFMDKIILELHQEFHATVRD